MHPPAWSAITFYLSRLLVFDLDPVENNHTLGHRGLGIDRPTGGERHWSLNFGPDQLADGRGFRVLAVVDDFARDPGRSSRIHRFPVCALPVLDRIIVNAVPVATTRDRYSASAPRRGPPFRCGNGGLLLPSLFPGARRHCPFPPRWWRRSAIRLTRQAQRTTSPRNVAQSLSTPVAGRSDRHSAFAFQMMPF